MPPPAASSWYASAIPHTPPPALRPLHPPSPLQQIQIHRHNPPLLESQAVIQAAHRIRSPPLVVQPPGLLNDLNRIAPPPLDNGPRYPFRIGLHRDRRRLVQGS